MTKIAEGRTAEVRMYGDGKIIKLFHSGFPKDAAHYEYKMSSLVYESGIATAKPYELLEYEGRTGIVYGYLHSSSTMLARMSAEPGSIEFYAEWMARLHAEMHSRSVDAARFSFVHSLHEALQHRIGESEGLTESEKEAVIRYLKDLPRGNSLCHSDFHPENVLIGKEEACIIDWMTGAIGHPAADAARTVLLLEMGSLPEGAPQLLVEGLAKTRSHFKDSYLRYYTRYSGISEASIRQWMLPIAAARLVEWIPDEEKSQLRGFIREELKGETGVMSHVNISLNRIEWLEGDAAVLSSLKGKHELLPLKPGLEAEVALVECSEGTFVAKLWNKESRPDIERQYKLLNILDAQGVRVSRPYGWGRDEGGNQLLLMEYGGKPLKRLDSDTLKKMAELLVDVHAFQTGQLPMGVIPTYDFVSYFFPALDQHSDINLTLQKALDHAQYKQTSLIHGDYNLGNLLEQETRLMIIDWTNGQMGDPRYDAAWSIFLITVYSGEQYGHQYAKLLQELGAFEQREYSAFQALACLRWLLLSRISDVPKDDSVMKRIRAIVSSNDLLNDGLL